MVTATPAYEGVAETDEAMPTPAPEATSALPGGGATDEATGSAQEVPTSAEETAAMTKTPGFGALFATTGLAAVAYLARRR